MPLIKIYVIDEPLFYDVSEVDLSLTRLIEIHHVDERGNLVCQEYLDLDIFHNSKELFHYRDDGKILSMEVFMGDSKIPQRKNVYEYDENGNLIKEEIFQEGESIILQRNEYDSSGNLIRNSKESIGEPLVSTVYHWHESIPEACVLEENFKGGTLIGIVRREYLLENNLAVLVGDWTDVIGSPEMTRICKYYNGIEMQNGVCMELFNEDEKYLEEIRETYDELGRVIRKGWYFNEDKYCVPYMEEVFGFDKKGNCHLYQFWRESKVVAMTSKLFDDQNRMIRKLDKNGMDSSVYFYVYAE